MRAHTMRACCGFACCALFSSCFLGDTEENVFSNALISDSSVASYDSLADDASLAEDSLSAIQDGEMADATATTDASPQPEYCHDQPDGVFCDLVDLRKICLAERCVITCCGDGYVNRFANEDCDDGNTVSEDGCTGCQWDCKRDADCDDGNVCNGRETCQLTAHRCINNIPPARYTACPIAADAYGICNAGLCIPAGCGNGVVDVQTESCDDGNQTSNDGCENDCSWTCQNDADCDDHDLCTGTLTCNMDTIDQPFCEAGVAVVCPYYTESCKGTCDPNTGECNYPETDSDGDGYACDQDCDDNDSDIHPGARDCLDGKDNDCDDSTADGQEGQCICYLDVDNDGFAAADSVSIDAVDCPVGYTTLVPSGDDIDCLDTDANAYPGQTQLFATPNALGFDYDCDGYITRKFNRTAMVDGCYTGSLCGSSYDGWDGDTIPGCGESGTYHICHEIERVYNGCYKESSTELQMCK